jgi:hypothetical protein
MLSRATLNTTEHHPSLLHELANDVWRFVRREVK